MSRPRHVPGSVVVYKVKPRQGKQPLARYLAARLGVVETWAADLLAAGVVTLDGEAAEVDTPINLSAGRHTIGISFPEVWPRHMAPTPMRLSVLYEDEDMSAVDKPPGIVVHPARGHLDNQTLQNGVRYRYRHLLGEESATIGPTHRLDKDTSGVCLFALNHSAYVNLTQQFASGNVEKEYVAVVDGSPGWGSLLCERPIPPDLRRKGLGKTASAGETGKRAATRFEVAARGNGTALIVARPLTGRPHQIRIHLSSLGLPICGDRGYNAAPDRHGSLRQALHASRLRIRHPVTGENVAMRSAIPDDMRQLVLQLDMAGEAEGAGLF
ncbi:MAG: RluA family pseudouridine synthase [Planctomycetota bacterium]|nr:RluA family pseudouridine synthase [Planctomycetota bacterium]